MSQCQNLISFTKSVRLLFAAQKFDLSSASFNPWPGREEFIGKQLQLFPQRPPPRPPWQGIPVKMKRSLTSLTAGSFLSADIRNTFWSSGLWARQRRTGPTIPMWRKVWWGPLLVQLWKVFHQKQVSWGLPGWASRTPPSPTTLPFPPSHHSTPSPPSPQWPPPPRPPSRSSTWAGFQCLPTFQSSNLKTRLHSRPSVHQLPFQSFLWTTLYISNPWPNNQSPWASTYQEVAELPPRMWCDTSPSPTHNISPLLQRSLRQPKIILRRSDGFLFWFLKDSLLCHHRRMSPVWINFHLFQASVIDVVHSNLGRSYSRITRTS